MDTSRSTNKRVTDMKSLSGGERSFTNMCFIMAVGKQISSPFHCLDEFDVSHLMPVLPDLGFLPGLPACTVLRHWA